MKTKNGPELLHDIAGVANTIPTPQLSKNQDLLLLLEMTSRFGFKLAMNEDFRILNNYVHDPNATQAEKLHRHNIVQNFAEFCGKGAAVLPLVPKTPSYSLADGASGPVLSLQQTMLFLSRLARPWTIPYIAPRLFLGLRDAEALTILRGKAPGCAQYPSMQDLGDDGRRLLNKPGSALSAWLAPYRRLCHDVPALVDPRISGYLAKQAAKLKIVWDSDLLTRTYAAYRLALTNCPKEIELHTFLNFQEVDQNLRGLVSRTDAQTFFSLSPRACRRHNWEDEVSQYLDWTTSAYRVLFAVPSNC